MSERVYEILLLVIVLTLLIQTIRYSLLRKVKTALEKTFASYRRKMDPLEKFRDVLDADAEASRIRSEAEAIRQKAQQDYDATIREAEAIRQKAQQDYDAKILAAEELGASELKESRAKAKEIRERAEKQLQDAHELANKIEGEARERATQIAGSALEAKDNAEQYEATVKAMKNIIKGYGDEYLIPNQGVLDELAAEYDHKEAGQELAKIRTLIKSMIKNGEAAECDYVEPYRRSTAIEFVLDAFNGKVDTIMVKVKRDNYGKLLQQLEDAFRLVNNNGKAFRSARINRRYYDVMVDQLKMAVAVQELKRIDQEEQRRIKEQMREEERARREYEKALKEAEREEKILQKAMAEAERRLAEAAEEERATFEEELSKLKEELAEAEARGQRALSMAQQTKRGHVYVISNIGSFGEEVFKIGLTRRLEPLVRIKELGDASVPFEFDVHAIIHSEDAPDLERKLHKTFEYDHVNKVNSRKEFFRLSLSTIKERVESLGQETHWTMKADAIEYRETLQIEKRGAESKAIQDQPA